MAVWALFVTLLLVQVGGATAQEPASGAATFGELTATPVFPSTIDFGLTAEAPQEIVRAELLYAPRGVETISLIEADFAPSRRIELTFPLDLYQNYLPTGLDIHYRWRLTDAAGGVTESPEQVVLWQDTRFAWQEVATDQVSVYFYTGNETFNRRILESAQATIDELQPIFGLERSRPIRIWIYNSRDDFTGAQVPNSESWFVGASYTGYYLIQLVIADGNDSEIGRIVPHEVSHQLLFQATENPFNLPPRWFDEGLAVYNQDVESAGYPATLQAAVDDGQLLPLSTLTREFPFDGSHHLAYAESLSVIQFIVAEWGLDGLGRVIAAYREGVSHDEAFEDGLGVTVAELEQRWRERLGYAGDRPLDDGTGGSLRSVPADDGGWPGVPWVGLGAASAVVVVLALRRRTLPGRDRLRLAA
jgi:hypothetical protein